MLKLAKAICLATAAFAAIPAQATTTILSGLGPDDSSVFFGATSNKTGAINDNFSFTVPAGTVSGFIGSIALKTKLDVVLTSVLLDGKSLFTQDLTGYEEKWSLADTIVGPGTHIIQVLGNWGTGGGSYSGTLNFSPAVPEPATWAMMIAGLGLVGASMRYRKGHVRFA
ncbi:MAG: PEP-CTERM sorting domain-containing protein [Sphingomonadales bacterium]|nr:PEP-CTERM sorting domain-containing protein [Sphingomonadales bacterium]